MIIKTPNSPHNEIDVWLTRAQAQLAGYPKAEVVKEDMSTSQLKGPYESCDVLAASGCAEDFGLPITETMLSGLPAIITNWSSQLDFASSQNSWLVNYQFIRVRTHFGLFVLTWASVNINDSTNTLKATASTNKSALCDMADAGHELILQ